MHYWEYNQTEYLPGGYRMHTGDNILKIRTEKNLTRRELSAAIDKEEAFLTEVEEKGMEPSVSDLLKIADVLDTDISALIYGKEFHKKGVVLTKADSRVRIDRRKSFDYENLAPYYSGRHIEPLLVEVYSGKPLEYSVHKGEEFHYVMEGTLKIVIEGKEYILETGDSIYFDSSLPHALTAVGEKAKILAAIYNSESMVHLSRSRKMTDLIQGAKHLGGMNLVIVIPNETAVEAANMAIKEDVVKKAFLIGDPEDLPEEWKEYRSRYEVVSVEKGGSDFDARCARMGVDYVRAGKGDMLMKGNINTAVYMRAILDKDSGISTGRRLSMVSMFEIPKLNRFIFLTDPGINPELTIANDLETSRDIILNAIDVAKSMGVLHPKVAILDANEKPSEKIPTSIFARELSKMEWGDAVVYGPLSYDLALYEESVKHKGLTNLPVAGKADILIVPHLAGGNFLYKAWAMTMSADVANVVLGAKVPVIITSRSDSDMTKFLTLCASAVYSKYLKP